MASSEAPSACPLSAIATTLGRARCRQPARIERMKQSLAAHGQLTPLFAVARGGTLELVDGFKRHAAAQLLRWPTLQVTERAMDETAQWAMMLALNRGPQSMTALEEALVLRELEATGLTQIHIAALVERHKSWVSRRIGLCERLHPELVEAMKLGLLHPGAARRLLSLPPGNQLEMAAAIQSARLGPRDTELLVSLWRKTKEPAARRALLSDPRKALARHHPETTRPPIDPRLSPQGQRLLRLLAVLERTSAETSRLLQAALPPSDLPILATPFGKTARAVMLLASRLGLFASASSAAASERSGETS
ncbi:MAG: ParB/RepB/Spo0J family partition protein [Burkholderiales bacterium]